MDHVTGTYTYYRPCHFVAWRRQRPLWWLWLRLRSWWGRHPRYDPDRHCHSYVAWADMIRQRVCGLPPSRKLPRTLHKPMTFNPLLGVPPMQTRTARALFTAGVILAASAAHAQDISAGKVIAQTWCRGCHIVDSQEQKTGSDTVPSFSSIAQMNSTTEMSL